MYGMAAGPVSREAQEDVPEAKPPVAPSKLRGRRWQFDRRLSAQYGGVARQGVLERVRPRESREGERLPSAGVINDNYFCR